MNSLVLAKSLKVSGFKLHGQILLPLLKNDLFKSFVLWFFVFFASFDIPYFVGGLRYGGIEVFLYEQIYWLGEWSRALGFSILIFLFWIFVAFVSPQKIPLKILKMKKWGWKDFGGITFLFFLPSLVVLTALLKGSFAGIDGLHFLAFKNTLGLGLSVGLSLFFVFTALLFWNPSVRFLNFLFYCAPPSSILIVFGIYLIPPHLLQSPLLRTLICFVLISFPFLYRLGFLQKRVLLQPNLKKAEAMGLSKFQRFRWVLFPQMLPVLALLSGLGALWSVGDFVTPSFFFPETPFLSRKIQFYLSGYQLTKAHGLVGPLSVVCLILSSIFSGVYFVTYRKRL